MTTVAIHQPMYLPYPGVFNKIKNSDVFVFLDDAQYTRSYFYNRNRVKAPDGELMLTVPVVKPHGLKLSEVRISPNVDWQERHFKTFERLYKKSDHYAEHRDYFEQVYSRRWDFLNDLNIETMRYLMEALELDVPVYYSSQLLKGEEVYATERLVAICNKLGATKYISGIGGKNYVDEGLFEREGIELVYQEYRPREYKQRFPPFIPNLSVVDLLFNMGERSVEFI